MKSCPFEENREFLVMYHDGVMPEELSESYSEHLLTCKPCMQALLDLRNDLFSMKNVRFVAVPGELGALAEVDAEGKMASARKMLPLLFFFKEKDHSFPPPATSVAGASRTFIGLTAPSVSSKDSALLDWST